jgi:hypothetical protein
MKKLLLISLAFAFGAMGYLASASAAKKHHHHAASNAGSCGTYMYWKNGKCNDARNK